MVRRRRVALGVARARVAVLVVAACIAAQARGAAAHASYIDPGCDANVHPSSREGGHRAPDGESSEISFGVYWCDVDGNDEVQEWETLNTRAMPDAWRVGTSGDEYAPGRRLTLVVDLGNLGPSEVLLTTSGGRLEEIGKYEDRDTSRGTMVTADKCSEERRANPHFRASKHLFIWHSPTDATEEVLVRVTSANGEGGQFMTSSITLRGNAALRVPSDTSNSTDVPKHDNSTDVHHESSSDADDSARVFVIHGVMMFIAFGMFMPAAVAWSRFGRPGEGQPPSGTWLKWHMWLMIAATAFVAISAFVAIGEINERGATHLDSAHTKWGLALMFIVAAQPINGYFRPANAASASEKSSIRTQWEWAHKSLGYFAVAAGVLTVCTGIDALSEHDESVPVRYYTGLFIVYMFTIIGFFAYTEHHKRQSPHARSSRAAFVELSQIDASLDDPA